MSDHWKAVLAVVLAALTSTGGTISIRLAGDATNLALAIAGASLWGLSGAGFVYASSKGFDLGMIAAVMSALGLITLNVVGVMWFGDSWSARKMFGLALIILAMLLISWPGAHD